MTYQEIIDAWNEKADGWNQWHELCEEEKIEFAFSAGITEGIIQAVKLRKSVDDNYNNGHC